MHLLLFGERTEVHSVVPWGPLNLNSPKRVRSCFDQCTWSKRRTREKIGKRCFSSVLWKIISTQLIDVLAKWFFWLQKKSDWQGDSEVSSHFLLPLCSPGLVPWPCCLQCVFMWAQYKSNKERMLVKKLISYLYSVFSWTGKLCLPDECIRKPCTWLFNQHNYWVSSLKCTQEENYICNMSVT